MSVDYETTKKNWITIETISYIIRKDVNNNLFNNIIDINNFKIMWAKLQFVYFYIN